jgi:hypothetical protein
MAQGKAGLGSPSPHNRLCDKGTGVIPVARGWRMATNLDVDIAAIEALMDLCGYRSKREAVDAAVSEAIAYHRQLRARDFLGTVDFAPVVKAGEAAER